MKRFIEKLFFVGKCRYFQIKLFEIIFYILYRLKFLLKYGKFDIFYRVAIETTTVCNRKCAYCPNSLYSRKQQLMDIVVFEKIISDLSKIDYSGVMGTHFYGEPLLDRRLPKLIGYIKEKLPKSRFELYTNGDFLSREMFEKLISNGTDKIIVSQHENKPSPDFMVWYEKATFFEKRKILLKKMDENAPLLSNRGGLVKIKTPKNVSQLFGKGCKRVVAMLNIDTSGNILLCCNDFFSQHKMHMRIYI